MCTIRMVSLSIDNVKYLFIVKYVNGIKNTNPIKLPIVLWKYSTKNILLNIFISTFSLLYSGVYLYISNSIYHSFSDYGYLYPIGFHFVIDNPDLLNLVYPPTHIINNINNDVINNQ